VNADVEVAEGIFLGPETAVGTRRVDGTLANLPPTGVVGAPFAMNVLLLEPRNHPKRDFDERRWTTSAIVVPTKLET
jgi:hypothetical protein